MPLAIVMVLLGLIALAIVAVRVSRARRRGGSAWTALPGERQLAWLGALIDDSVGMWAVRRLLGRSDADPADPADEPFAPEGPEWTPLDRLAVLLGDRPPPTRVELHRERGATGRTGHIAGHSAARDRLPHARPRPDPRGRLGRDAALVLVVLSLGGIIVLTVQPAGFLGGVASATGSPEASLPLVNIGAIDEPSHSPIAQPARTAAPAQSPTPGPRRVVTPTPTPATTQRPTPGPTPRVTPAPTPTRAPTPGPTATPTATPAAPIARITSVRDLPCTTQGGSERWTFTGATSLRAVSYSWTFIGGSQRIAGSTEAVVTRDFPGSTAGTVYTIILSVKSSSGASDNASTEITVSCP
jgi:hypothetical protein